MEEIKIREVCGGDRGEWLRMRVALWAGHAVEELEGEMEEWLRGGEGKVFVAERCDGRLCGFLEAAVRPCDVNGTVGRIGYVEGWYVDADVREQGIGRLLVEETERWAAEQGCRELWSDAEIANELSQAAHGALGFLEVGRIVHYRKRVGN